MKAFLATALLLMAPAAFAQTFSATPPLAQSRADVFDWRETPRNQPIPIVRAVFDSNGYLLTDENGQMISVPFSGNLYAMQFGKTNSAMYFVNEGNNIPTLYLPDNGFLENAAVANGRWFPFPQRYFYTRPVYMGLAPSWDAYCGMGWFPGMTVFGGYWGNQPWRSGIVYSPMSCLTISVGNRFWNNWDDYCGFWPGAGIRPIVIRDTRPIFVDQRNRWDGSRDSIRDKDWDRGRPTFRQPSRPGFQAPARFSEERAQGQGSSDRFNFGTSPSASRGGNNTVFGGGTNPGGSREREFGRSGVPTTPSYSVPNMTPNRPSTGGFTPPNSGGSREREFGRPGTSTTPSYSVPNMTPVRPGGTPSNGNGSPFPSRESREMRGGFTPPSGGTSPSFGRGNDSRPTGRTYEPSRESRSSAGSSSTGSSRSSGSSSRSRERGKG
jgi:hypothetical protein